MSSTEIACEARDILSIEKAILPNQFPENSISEKEERYKHIWKKITDSDSPIFIATDGAHQESKGTTPPTIKQTKQHSSASSFVICQADMSSQNTNQPNSWIHRPCIPLLCRISSLPKYIGTDTSNVAHAEAHAIAMQEWILPSSIPRILVTDSESVRNVCLGLRNMESIKINRKLIRTLLSGVSKFITSDILQHLQQRQSKPPLNMEKIVKVLETRIRNLLPIAKEWTTPPLDDGTDLNQVKYGKWRTDYFDENCTRAFFKVNSHQLNEKGTDFNPTKRYPKLTPNLSLLNMNHHADQGADLGDTLNALRPLSKNSRLCNPPSALRFFFSWEGSSVDSHISDFVRRKIFDERLSRLKTKKTQGLLWRYADHVTVDWDDINKHRGWWRSLTGLSRTHTRSLYKSETYRTGCRLESDTVKICRKCDEPLPMKKKDIIKKHASCMWCPNHHTQECPEGNRNHLFLQCQHPDISTFRNKMTNLIEQKVRFLFLQFKEATNLDSLKSLLKKVEKECLSLQSKTNLNPSHRNKLPKRGTYVDLANLMQKYEINDIQEAFVLPGPFFSEALGILPQSFARNVKDEELSILDAFWLGLTPTRLHKLLLTECNSHKFLPHCPDVASCKHTSNVCLSTWDEIQDLIMAKAIGIHRIVGTISKSKEKAYRKKFDIVKGTYMDPLFRQHMNKKRKRKPANPHLPASKKSKILPTSVTEIKAPPEVMGKTILCNGITCNRNNKRWCLDQNFS